VYEVLSYVLFRHCSFHVRAAVDDVGSFPLSCQYGDPYTLPEYYALRIVEMPLGSTACIDPFECLQLCTDVVDDALLFLVFHLMLAIASLTNGLKLPMGFAGSCCYLPEDPFCT